MPAILLWHFPGLKVAHRFTEHYANMRGSLEEFKNLHGPEPQMGIYIKSAFKFCKLLQVLYQVM